MATSYLGQLFQAKGPEGKIVLQSADICHVCHVTRLHHTSPEDCMSFSGLMSIINCVASCIAATLAPMIVLNLTTETGRGKTEPTR